MSTDIAAPGMIHGAIIKIMRAVAPIAKDQRNTQQNYNFRGIDQVYNAVHPHFAEHGVYSTSEILSAEHRACEKASKSPGQEGKAYIHAILKMRFTFWAEDGSHVPTEVVGEGIDYGGDKASNKAMSTADKYAILQLLKIPTAAMDNDQGRQRPSESNAELMRKALVAIEDAKTQEKLDAIKQRIKQRDEYTDDQRTLLNERIETKRRTVPADGVPA